jgi:hypothetical protein
MSALLSVCWAPRGASAESMCAGAVTWTRVGGSWRSKCAKCSASGMAAVGERTALDAMRPMEVVS